MAELGSNQQRPEVLAPLTVLEVLAHEAGSGVLTMLGLRQLRKTA